MFCDRVVTESSGKLQRNEMTRNVAEAACSGEWERVRLLVAEGENVNDVARWTFLTALHFAVLHGKADICSFLLSRGANVTKADVSGDTPLHIAADWHRADICQLLVDHKADVTCVNNKGETPLVTALASRHYLHDIPAVCCPLITNESVNVADRHGNCAVHIAVEKGHIQTVQLLVNGRANVNVLKEDGQTALHTAAGGEKDCPELCSILLTHNAKIDAVDKDGNQPLHLACKQWHTATVRLLLSHRADITALNKQQRKPLHLANESILKSYKVHNGNQPLHIAAKKGHIQTVQLLMDCGADVNALNEDGQTPLHTAAGGEKDWHELCSILLEHDANIDAVDKDGNQPLHLACKQWHTATVRLLLSHGADVTALNNQQRKPSDMANESILKSYEVHNGNQPLHIAAKKGCIQTVQTVQLLLDCGADVNALNEDGQTPLHTAADAEKDCSELCSILLTHNAKIDAVDKDGNQPLHLACKQWHTATVRLLLSHGADVTALNNQQRKPSDMANESILKSYEVHNGNQPLHIAAKKGCIQTVQTVQLLLDCGADVNALNEDGQTPLHTAADAEKDCSELCSILLTHNAKIDAVDKDGNQPLHLACKQWHTATVRLLLSHGADVTALNNQQRKPLDLKSYEVHNGNQPLHIAAQKVCIQTVQLLVDCGADVNALNEDGQTPLHTVASGEKDCPELCSILLKHNAKIDAVDKDGNQPLHLACEAGLTSTVQCLLSYNADVFSTNNFHQTALHKAVCSERDCSKVCEMLIAKGSRVNVTDSNGHTSLQLACQKGNLKMFNMLVKSDADCNVLNVCGETLLHLACKSRVERVELCGKLISHGVSPHIADREGNLPLHVALQNRLGKTFCCLFQNSGDAVLNDLHKLNIEREDLMAIFSSAHEADDIDTCRHILEFSAKLDPSSRLCLREVNCHTTTGYSLIQRAVKEKDITFCQHLIDHGASVNADVPYGSHGHTLNKTPLHLAVKMGHCDLCRLLIEHGATIDPQIKGRKGALHVAVVNEQNDMVRLLLSHGADMSKVLIGGKSALKRTETRGNVKMASIIQASGE